MFVILIFTAMILATTMMSEVLVYGSGDLPTAYACLGSVAGLLFVTSGLILKPGSFPNWLRPWAPSLSVLRWIMQAGFICLYYENYVAFPNLAVPGVNYTLYTEYLKLFGWGGKTKWYCFYMLLVNVAVFRVGALVCSSYAAFRGMGTHRSAIEY